VFEQWPEAGDRVQPAIVTAGIQGVSMPDVTGRTEQEALGLLQRFEEISVQKRYTGRSPAGQVLEQQPRANSTVTGRERVRLIVEDEPAVVPPLVRLDRARALEALREAGLELGNEVARADSAEPGTIIDQDPKPNAPVAPGSKVNIVVAAAREPVPADLTVQGLVWESAPGVEPGYVWVDAPFHVTVTVANRSNVAVDQAFDITVTLIGGDQTNPEPLNRRTLSRLGARASASVTFDVVVGEVCGQGCSLRFAVNESRALPETDFGNNSTSTPIVVRSDIE
jgi:beta-lactam-binding protein with PASTA domain